MNKMFEFLKVINYYV